MAGNDLQSGNIQPIKSKVVKIHHKGLPLIEPKVIRTDEKFEVEIRELVRIRPRDFEAFKNSFEEWRDKWEK